MKERVKNIAIILIGIISITSLTVSAATLINSKDVVYDNTASGLRSTTVQGAVDELYSAATDYSSLSSRTLTLENNLKPTKYIKPTPIDGVRIKSNGYYRVGNIVFVSINLSIDASKVTLPKNINNRTVILTNLPKAVDTGFLYYTYPYNVDGVGTADYFGLAYVNTNGELLVTQSAVLDQAYASNWGFKIIGTYLTKE